MKRRQELLQEDLPPALAELLRLLGMIIPPGHLFDDLIAALADQPPYPLELDVDSRLREGLDPGMGVGVVAVNERTVNIKQYSANRAHEVAFARRRPWRSGAAVIHALGDPSTH